MRNYSCVFCDIVAEEAPAVIVGEWNDTIAFVPLNPLDGLLLPWSNQN